MNGRDTKILKKYLSKVIILSSIGFMILACSTAKNTAVRRGFHQMKVKYNIFFNGNTAFLEGQQEIIKANEDDYNHVLNLYPVSNHKAAEASATQMEKTIEKCRKCIKLHSIQVKPKINPKKKNDPKYKLWLEQKEFNNQMGNAWLRLGEAEFHKGDFLESIGTFSYISKFYENDPDMVARCQLWMARAYSELGWLYEVDDIINKINVDNLKRKHASLYTSVFADILIKKQLYEPATLFVKKALPAEKRNLYRPRFQYVLGQLYELQGKKNEAYNAYKKVVHMTPPAEMDFHARIKLAQLKPKRPLKKLKTLGKQFKYHDKMDMIYGAMGDIYMEKKDTTNALIYYHLAIDTCQQANYNKASILIKTGDIYYKQKKYQNAQPCYKEASNIISPEHEDQQRITKLLDALDELIREYEIVHLQDSLQQLSKMTQEEQMLVVQNIIEQKKLQEQAQKEKEQQDARNKQNNTLKSVDTKKMFGDQTIDNAWYFYNEQLVKNGKSDFQNTWGNRQLEDNWRRLSKSNASIPIFDQNSDEQNTEDQNSDEQNLFANNTPNQTQQKNQQTLDDNQPAFYLQQIPKTAQDIKNSDSLIRNALYDMIFTYLDKIEDFEATQITFEDFKTRFPNDKKLPDILFMLYLYCIKTENNEQASLYKNELLSRFPQSKQATVISNPEYLTTLQQMILKQDSLYEKTYQAFKNNNFTTVKKNTKLATKQYAMSPLIPNFLFLDAIATARTDGQKKFIKKLNDLLENYPDSEPSAMAKTFLSLINEGKKTKQGDISSNLNQMRNEQLQQQYNDTQQQTTINNQNTFSDETNTKSFVLFFINSTDETLLNNLLYEIALFNFSQFLIKDFDIKVSPIFGNGAAIRVLTFDNIKEADWYLSLIIKNEQMGNYITNNGIQIVPITEENFKLINTKFTFEEYLDFYKTLKNYTR